MTTIRLLEPAAATGKTREIFDAVLAAHDKRRATLAVAMAARGRHMIESHAAILRHAGDTDRDILEVFGVIDHHTTLNTLSDSMQIASDIRPPA